MTPARARIRLSPWALRRRVKGVKDGDVLGDMVGHSGDLGDDPFSFVLGLLLLTTFGLLVVVPFLLGLALLPFELLALVLVGGGALLLQVAGLRPFTVAVEQQVGGRWTAVGRVQRTGLRAARAERDALQRELTTAPPDVVLARRGVAVVPVAGWYADPEDAAALRFWDGTAWTEQVQPRHSG